MFVKNLIKDDCRDLVVDRESFERWGSSSCMFIQLKPEYKISRCRCRLSSRQSSESYFINSICWWNCRMHRSFWDFLGTFLYLVLFTVLLHFYLRQWNKVNWRRLWDWSFCLCVCVHDNSASSNTGYYVNLFPLQRSVSSFCLPFWQELWCPPVKTFTLVEICTLTSAFSF